MRQTRDTSLLNHFSSSSQWFFSSESGYEEGSSWPDRETTEELPGVVVANLQLPFPLPFQNHLSSSLGLGDV